MTSGQSSFPCVAPMFEFERCGQHGTWISERLPHTKKIADFGGLAKVMPIFAGVFLFTSSSTGVWEAAVRNCVSRKVLCCMQGAFSDRWQKVALANGKEAGSLQVEWGRAITAEMIDQALAGGGYDAIAVVHNETSTGVTSNVQAVRNAIDRAGHPALLLVDTISSLGSIDYRHDEWGVDVTVCGSQKGLMLPPGISRDRMAGDDAAALRASFRAEFAVHDDQRVILFVRLRDGVELTGELVKRIRTAIRTSCSPRRRRLRRRSVRST